jgi:hypothetical protein
MMQLDYYLFFFLKFEQLILINYSKLLYYLII